MFKRFLLVLFSLLLAFNCFALDYNVGICPNESNIAELIKEYFPKKSYDSNISIEIRSRNAFRNTLNTGKTLDEAWKKQDLNKINSETKNLNKISLEKDNNKDFDVKIVNLSKSVNQEVLLESDNEMLELFCKLNNIDLLIIPSKTEVAGFFLYKLYVFEPYSQSLELVFQFLSQKDQGYNRDCINSLSPYFENLVFDIVSEETEVKPEKTVYHDLTLSSNVECDVWFEGKLLGKTPLVIPEYTVPSVFRFTAEGYQDKIESVNKETSILSVSLLNDSEEGLLNYQKAREDFYRSFGETLITIGFKALALSVSSQWPQAQKYVDIGTWAVVGASAGLTVYRLVKYFTSAKYVSP